MRHAGLNSGLSTWRLSSKSSVATVAIIASQAADKPICDGSDGRSVFSIAMVLFLNGELSKAGGRKSMEEMRKNAPAPPRLLVPLRRQIAARFALQAGAAPT